MTHKVKIQFSEKEVKLAADIHKDITIKIAKEVDHIKNSQKKFHLITLVMSITISNMLNNFNIRSGPGLEYYLDDFSDLVKQLHSSVRENASYIKMRDGEVVGEGEFH